MVLSISPTTLIVAAFLSIKDDQGIPSASPARKSRPMSGPNRRSTLLVSRRLCGTYPYPAAETSPFFSHNNIHPFQSIHPLSVWTRAYALYSFSLSLSLGHPHSHSLFLLVVGWDGGSPLTAGRLDMVDLISLLVLRPPASSSPLISFSEGWDGMFGCTSFLLSPHAAWAITEPPTLHIHAHTSHPSSWFNNEQFYTTAHGAFYGFFFVVVLILQAFRSYGLGEGFCSALCFIAPLPCSSAFFTLTAFVSNPPPLLRDGGGECGEGIDRSVN